MNANGTVGDWNLVTCDTFSGAPNPWFVTDHDGRVTEINPDVNLISFSTDENDDPLIAFIGPDFKQVVRMRGTLKMMDEGVIEITEIKILNDDYEEVLGALFYDIIGWTASIGNTRGGSKTLHLLPSDSENGKSSVSIEGF